MSRADTAAGKSEAVFDICLIHYAGLDVRQNLSTDRVEAVREGIRGNPRPRFSPMLAHLYRERLKFLEGNELFQSFVHALDDPSRSTRVEKSGLRRHETQKARDCNWPSHDDLLLAVAIPEPACAIRTTEQRLARCRQALQRVLRVKVEFYPPP